jgi:HlyD family secretion protein
MKAKSIALLLIAALPLAGCVNREAQAQAKETEAAASDTTVEVAVRRVMPVGGADVLQVTGQIQAAETVAVSPVLPGRLVRVNVREGDRVSAGQVLAQQDARDAETQIRQANAQVAAAESALAQARIDADSTPERSQAAIDGAQARVSQARQNLAKAEAGARPEEKRQAEAAVARAESDLKTAKASLDRFRRLHAEGAIALSELEAVENRYDNAMAAYRSAVEGLALANNAVRSEDLAAARQEVRAAEANLDSARAAKGLDALADERIRSAQANLRSAREAVTLARKQLGDLTIRAPFSGRVQGRPLQVGTVASPGIAVVNLVGLESAFFEASVPEARLSQVQVGQAVDVIVEALPGAKLAGRVSAINPSAGSVGRLFIVRISLERQPEQLRAGMFAEGEILLREVEGIYMVPLEAVLEQGGERIVYVLDGADAVRQAKVEVRKTEGGMSQVLGLSPGDEVVVQGQTKLFPESKVRIAAEGAGA